MNGPRVYLGRSAGLEGRQRVYRTADALEVHDIEAFSAVVRRLFYDEILTVTRHSALGWGLLATSGAVVLLMVGAAVIVGLAASVPAGLVTFAVGGLPFLGLFLLRLVRPVEVVTVFGRRGRARLRFWLRPGRADEVFALVCRLARERQTSRPREADPSTS